MRYGYLQFIGFTATRPLRSKKGARHEAYRFFGNSGVKNFAEGLFCVGERCVFDQAGIASAAENQHQAGGECFL